MKKLYSFLFSALVTITLFAQTEHTSFMQEQHDFYARFHFIKQAQWDSLDAVIHPSEKHSPYHKETSGCILNKRVFGWLPYWTTTTQENDLNLSLLSDIAYCEYDVNASTGGYTSIHNWTTDACITKALTSGVRVELTAQLFSNHATFFGSLASEDNFITTIINLVKARGANGVNIDFEGVPSAQSANLTAFMELLCDSVHARIPGGVVTVAAPAVNWSGTWNVSALSPYVDLWIIMGYDYYYAGSPNAGPCAPLTGGGFWGSYDCSSSVIYYLNSGVVNNKLALGVPYYGYDWPTSSAALYATTTGSGTAILYNTAATNAKTYGRIWDNYSLTPHYTYGSYHQCWYEDNISLGDKYNMVNMQNMAGIGIWALGYDDGDTTAWDAIQENFTSCATVSCSGEFRDLGDTGNYYNNENWTWTLAPTAASSVTATFSAFNTTTGDILSIYNGSSVLAPLIGNYQGTTSPGTVIGTTGSLTFHFSSSSSGPTAAGWVSTWGCTTGSCTSKYATIPYSTSFENPWILDSCNSGVQRIPDEYWKSSIGGTSPNANDYWHRDDYTGIDWTNPTIGQYTPAASNGSYSARFHNDPPPAGSTGALDLYIDLSPPGKKTISFDYIHNEASPAPFSFDVLLSTDGGNTFPTNLLSITNAQVSVWTTQLLTTAATSATSVLRFIVTDKGTEDVGIDNLNIIGTPTGIDDISNESNLSVYPNPFSRNFTVNYTLNKDEQVNISLIDMLGRATLIHSADNETAGLHKLNIDFSSLGLAKGVYILGLRTGNGGSFVKLIAD